MVARPSSPIDAAASAYIRGYVRMTQITYPYLSAQTGISIMTLRRYVSGDRTMPLGDFLSLLNALGLDDTETLTKIRAMAEDPESSSASQARSVEADELGG